MKKRFLVIFSIVFVFGLFVTAYALTDTDRKTDSTASCPMQQSQSTKTTDDVDLSKVMVVKRDGDDCCQPGANCCKGGSCCKMNKKK